MDFLLLSLQTTVVAVILTFSIILCLLLLRNGSRKRGAPEAGGAWPLIGHLYLLVGPEPPHRVLGDMADKYGPIFTIKMGVHRALVVSNWEMAKECLTTHDKVFANRPKTLAMEILGYDFSVFVFSPYDLYWRQMRKIATIELLSNHRLKKLRRVREFEVRTALKELYEFWVIKRDKSSSSSNKVLVEMKRWFEEVTLNIILRVMVGKQCNSEAGSEDHEGWKEELTRFFALSGKFTVSDALPFLRWLDIGGDEKLMKKTSRELDIVVQGWLDEHKRKRDSGEMERGDEDFMDVMLSILDNEAQKFPDRDADTIIKAICLTLILGATNTTIVTLTWIISLLLIHPDVLRKAQKELDVHVGTERQVNEVDMENLVYIQAIVKEAMRLYPAAPLSVPHESTEDCTVNNNFYVPAGTRLLVNIWKIHRDPRIWSEPYKFEPERFLTTHKDLDVQGQDFEFIPFSSGRRMCPGVSFALQVTQLTLATLLHGFDLTTPSNDERVDMSEGIGLSLVKSTPLQVHISPRLSASLYA